MTEKHLIGMAKVTKNHKITIVKKVHEELGGIDVGDSVAYYRKNGDTVVEKT